MKNLRAICLAFVITILSVCHAVAQQPTAMELAAEMYPGWNLGNTLEPGPCNWLSNPIDWETAWQGSKTTQEIIDFVKA